MKFAVIVLPGSNCDIDMFHAVKDELGEEVEYVWHEETSLDGFDGVLIPGGFSYGDYLRCGAIARFANIMPAVKKRSLKENRFSASATDSRFCRSSDFCPAP